MLWTTKRKPTQDTYVLVFVGYEYCESGYQVAKWDGENWESDSGDLLTEYVQGWTRIGKFEAQKNEKGLTFKQQLAELVLTDDDELEITNVASVKDWPKIEGESLVLENYEVKRLEDDHLLIWGGGDWQEPHDVTVKQVDGVLTAVSYEPADVSEEEPLDEDEVIQRLRG